MAWFGERPPELAELYKLPYTEVRRVNRRCARNAFRHWQSWLGAGLLVVSLAPMLSMPVLAFLHISRGRFLVVAAGAVASYFVGLRLYVSLYYPFFLTYLRQELQSRRDAGAPIAP